MMSKETDNYREQIQMFCSDDLVPENHILRKIDKAINFDFIYDLVEDKYSQITGRPSIDPVMLIKIPMVQYLFGIKSMRQTIKEIEVNVAYKWFLGLGLTQPVPHFSTFGKNYSRRFKDTDLFEQIFTRVLEMCYHYKFVDTSVAFVDATHIKAAANKRKAIKHHVKKEVMYYEDALQKEIKTDRENHGKKPLKNKDDDDPKGGQTKEVKQSTVDPESGLFHKGEHKEVFAYSAQTACDINGWILAYTLHPGNEHDSRTFPHLYKKLKELNPKKIVADKGYRTPAIAKMLLDDGIDPIFPYKRPMTKKGFISKRQYIYDEYYDAYLCPGNQLIEYSTTNRKGYREYKSDSQICQSCPHLDVCTHSKNSVKVITRHVWEDYLDHCENLRFEINNKQLYEHRKETIERIFGTAKENHGLRYTQEKGKARMQLKVGLTFTCMNMKKLAMMLDKKGLLSRLNILILTKGALNFA